MAHQTVKPYSLLMYFLSIITFFFLGLIYASITEAGKGQMLAGGTIVLGYGVIGAFIGLFLSILTAIKSKRNLIIKINVFLALIIIALFTTYFSLKHQRKQQKKLKDELPKREQPTTPALDVKPLTMLTHTNIEKQLKNEMGLGMFSPYFYEHKTLYFYENLTHEKSIQEHTPIDSITFKQFEHGSFYIATAPPWLMLEHMKLDYDILYFKVKSISHDFIEVVVNTKTNQTAFLDRYAGKLQYWPEFLLSTHSVEFRKPSSYNIHIKPLDLADTVTISYSYMRPIKIQNEWLYVELQDNNYKTLGTGWIRWRKDDNLLIKYSLLN